MSGYDAGVRNANTPAAPVSGKTIPQMSVRSVKSTETCSSRDRKKNMISSINYWICCDTRSIGIFKDNDTKVHLTSIEGCSCKYSSSNRCCEPICRIVCQGDIYLMSLKAQRLHLTDQYLLTLIGLIHQLSH